MAEMAITNSLFQNATELEMETGVITVASNVPPNALRNVVRIKTVETETSDISDSAADSLSKGMHTVRNIQTDGWQVDTIDVVVICIVLVILIRALTIIALKRGFSFSKGNVVFHVGEKKKTRKRTKTKSKTENSD
jgi:hypothetical protein